MLCHEPDFDREGFSDKTVLICDQCEKEYHIGCLRQHKMVDMQVCMGCAEGAVKW